MALMTYMVKHNAAHANELAELAKKLGDMGDKVWPATITSVTVNNSYIPVSTTSPAPAYTMSASEITDAELKAAASRASFSVSAEELTRRLFIRRGGGGGRLFRTAASSKMIRML